jgi:NTE family protein
MSREVRSALVLQGGGALGAYELGAARALFEDQHFVPGFIAGVSIGAITATLLSRPARGLTPLGALEKFWSKVAVPGVFLPPALRSYASIFGSPSFFTPRLDYVALASWTNIYDLAPLRSTLSELVNLDSLGDREATPRLLVSALDVIEGEVRYFYSRDDVITLDHIIASSSLPPSFPMTKIGESYYWDGGLFDNTPLGAVLQRLDQPPEAERVIYVVNLFPNKAPLPGNLLEVNERVRNLQFANKTTDDVKMLHRIDEVVDLLAVIDQLPDGTPLKKDPAYLALKTRNYVRAPKVVQITQPHQVGGFDASDFSPDTIEKRQLEGYILTKKALDASR